MLTGITHRRNWDQLAQLCLLSVFAYYCFFLPSVFFIEAASDVPKEQFQGFLVVSPLVGYLMGLFIRPLGGLFLGLKADQGYVNRTIRRSGIILGASTMAMGALPIEADLGGPGTYLLVLLRLVQGYTIAGLYTAAATFAMKASPEKQCGFFTGVLQSSTSAGHLAVMTVLIVLRLIFNKVQFVDWAWRLAYGFAAILIIMAWSWRPFEDHPVGISRRTLLSDLWTTLKSDHKLRKSLIWFVLPAVGLGSLISYHGTVYQMTFLQGQLRLDPVVVKFILAMASLVYLPFYGLWGWLGDRYGHGRMFVVGIVIASVLLFPAFYLFDSLAKEVSMQSVGMNRYVWVMVLAIGMYSIISILSMSNVIVFLHSRLPERWRSSLFGFVYNISFGLWAAFSQLSGLYLQERFNSSYGSILFTLFFALLTLIMVLTVGRPFIYPEQVSLVKECGHPQGKP
ncbi:MAG: MFS transporter [Bdellovibrio sp.]|nr:MFS transporter [Bdellovibrio sp.]